MSTERHLKETDLYIPLKSWLELQGYTVRGEVGKCDLAAAKDGELIAVELKTRPSLALLAQAAERQEYADAVYVALPATSDRRRPPASRDFRRLLRRLGIGLLLVTFLKTKTKVEVLMHPKNHSGIGNHETAEGGSAANGTTEGEHSRKDAMSPPRRRPKKKAALLREISGRDMDLTPGGLPGGRERVTAYRQRALRLAVWLNELGEAAPAQLVALGAPADAGVILQKNLYGWFERVRRGVYRLHSSGKTALNSMPKLAALYQKELQLIPKTNSSN